MKCPHCGQRIELPQDKETRWVRFLECLERNQHNRTRTARELGVSVRSVRNWLKAMGLGHKPVVEPVNPREKRWTKDEIQTMLALGKQGFTYKEIARELGRTILAVKGKAQMMLRLQKQREAVQKVHLTANMIRRQRILTLHQQGLSLKMIASDLGLPIETVREHIKDWRVK